MRSTAEGEDGSVVVLNMETGYLLAITQSYLINLGI